MAVSNSSERSRPLQQIRRPTVVAAKAEFMAINLGQVGPRACFKALKGVGSAKLSGLSTIAPVMQMRRDDGRFISACEVANIERWRQLGIHGLG
jgi:hypothetical protein